MSNISGYATNSSPVSSFEFVGTDPTNTSMASTGTTEKVPLSAILAAVLAASGTFSSAMTFSSTTTHTGLATFNGGTSTAGTATVATPTVVSGTAFQVNTTQDVMFYASVKTSASQTVALAIGSTSSVTTTLITSGTGTGVIGSMISVRVPKGWYIKFTGTVADWTFTTITC